MTITGSSPWRSEPRISRERFSDIIRDRANPELSAERDPAEYWGQCVVDGVDPLFIVAMFNHESSLGKAGTARTTHSWGNTRSPNFGAKPVGTVAGRSGVFPVWENWMDGLKSTTGRLVSAEWVYSDRETIREIFDWPADQDLVWAPAGDMNDPHGYLRAVLDFMNKYAEVEAPSVPTTTSPKPAMISKPSPNKNGYREPRKVEAICNHIATATLASNLSWLTNPASGVSSNYYIAKSGDIYELVPYTSSAWGNGVLNKPDMSNPLIAAWARNGINPNTRTVSIEHEGEASDTLTEAQIAANNRLTAWLASETGIAISRTTIIGHYQIDSVNKPFCPSFSDEEWRRLVDGANALLNKGDDVVSDTNERDMGNGYTIRGSIRAFWERAEQAQVAYQGFGLPVGPEHEFEHDGNQVVAQPFERSVLIYDASLKSPWDVSALFREDAILDDSEARDMVEAVRKIVNRS